MRSTRWAGLVLLGVLSVAACGARLSDQELATARAPRSGAALGNTATTFGPGSEGEGAQGTGGTTPSGSNGDGGTIDGGSSGSTVPGASSGGCQGKTASDVGVTATEMRVGQIATIGGPVPGFGDTGRAGLRAFIAYINSQGGICGRKLVMIPGDDRLEAGANRSETERMMDDVFAFVSNTSVADDGGAGVLEGTNVPQVGLSTSKAAGELSTNFSPSPVDYKANRNGAGPSIRYFKQKYGVSRAGLVWPSNPVARTAAERYETDLVEAGIEIVYRQEVGVTETNYSGVASQIENNEVDIVITTLEFNGIARLARAMETNGYLPKVPFYGAQTYGRKFLEVAGSAANGTKLGIAFEPFESRTAVPEVDLFLDWYTRVNPGVDVDFFSVMAWVSARMFTDALKAIGAEPTRDALLAELRTYTDITLDNFVGHINPAQKKSARCFLVVEIISGRWVKTHPKGPGFAC